ncbi:hypothetical protein BC829DRAFT_395475 [Chytridium lagenaria]|nr:hypothetical protein BC829DRAFT_395475 [Chytridium lagenaria]
MPFIPLAKPLLKPFLVTFHNHDLSNLTWIDLTLNAFSPLLGLLSSDIPATPPQLLNPDPHTMLRHIYAHRLAEDRLCSAVQHVIYLAQTRDDREIWRCVEEGVRIWTGGTEMPGWLMEGFVQSPNGVGSWHIDSTQPDPTSQPNIKRAKTQVTRPDTGIDWHHRPTSEGPSHPFPQPTSPMQTAAMLHPHGYIHPHPSLWEWQMLGEREYSLLSELEEARQQNEALKKTFGEDGEDFKGFCDVLL